MSNSEKRKLHQQRIQSQKLETIGSLAGGIAHDFNNMLTSIINNIDMALDDIDESVEAFECLNDAKSVSRRAKNLVEQILSFSKQRPESAKPVVIYDIVLEAMEMLKSTIPPGVKVKIKVKDNSARIMGVCIQIYQLIINLCINSCHAMKKSGGILEISIETKHLENKQNHKREKFVKLTIRDTGAGMSKETIGQIFDPLFTTKNPDESTGLGLAVVHEIVEGHHGKITVNSKEGEGTTFKILFPQI